MALAARIGDIHACVLLGHGIGAIVEGDASVLIEGMPAARTGDAGICLGGIIATKLGSGSATVLIGKRRAARLGDTTCHGGVVASSNHTVLIGDESTGAMDLAKRYAAPFVAREG